MSVLRTRRDLDDLHARMGRVLDRAARSGVMASAAGTELGDALNAIADCRAALSRPEQTESRDQHPALARIPDCPEGVAPAA